MNCREAGRLGGIQTALTHDMRAIGQLGGRPPLPTYEEIIAGRKPASSNDNEKEDRIPAGLGALKRLWYARINQPGTA